MTETPLLLLIVFWYRSLKIGYLGILWNAASNAYLSFYRTENVMSVHQNKNQWLIFWGKFAVVIRLVRIPYNPWGHNTHHRNDSADDIVHTVLQRTKSFMLYGPRPLT